MAPWFNADELHRIAAHNGFVAGAHQDEDEVVQNRDPFTDRYLKNQQESLDLWIIFMAGRANPAAECLYPGCPVPSNVLVKDFARWYCASRSGRVDKRPNLTTVKNMLKKFFGGFVRVTGTEISDEYRKDLYTWAQNTLVKQGYTTTKRREKYLFDVNDLVHVIVSAWTKYDNGFFHECMRVQMTFLLLIYCFTGARVGAFLHNGKSGIDQGGSDDDKVTFQGLTWKDVIVYLMPLSDGTTEIVLKIVQRWTKNNKDPENSVSEISTYSHKKIRFDVASYLLALAFRDDVFEGIASPAQLWRQRVPAGDALLELRMKPSKLDTPVLRTITRNGGISDRMLDDSTFRYYFQRIVSNAGYYGALTIHALRRALANAVDKRATAAERNQILGHSGSDMFGRAYISSISSVDGQAAFLREEARTDHIAKLRSVSTRKASGLPQKLSSERRMELLNDPKVSEFHRHLCDLRAQDAPPEEIQVANRQFRIYRNTCKRTALDKWKEDWLDDRYRETIASGGLLSSNRSTDVDRVQALFRAMPERARLADMIVSDEVGTRNQNLLAVQDLLSLCQRDFEVMYRPGDEPIGNSCPVCHKQLPNKPRDRPEHIYHCRRNALKSTSYHVQYCFLCFRWFVDALDWEQHCLEHLLSMNTVWCGLQTYCHTVICPGYCPFCLSDERLSASKRLRAWIRNYQLMEHVNEHLADICSSKFSCPHPLCHQQLESVDQFRHHLSDIHGLARSQKEAFDEQRDADMKNTNRQSAMDIETDGSCILVKERKKGKRGERKEIAFVAWSPSLIRHPPPRRSAAARTKSGKRRRVEDGIEKPCDVPVNGLKMKMRKTSDVCSDMTTKSQGIVCDNLSQSRIDLSEDDSILVINGDEDLTGNLPSPPQSLHEKTLAKVAGNLMPQTSSVLKHIAIPIDPTLLAMDKSPLSGAFIQTPEKTHVDERNHPLLDRKRRSGRQESPENSIATPKPWPIGLAQESPLDRWDQWDRGVRAEESLSLSRFAHDEPKEPLPQPASKVAFDFKCPLCKRNVPAPAHNKPMKFSLQKSFCENHQKREAEVEWARLEYPRISWRRLSIRLSKKASALQNVIDGHSFSFFRAELQTAIDKKEPRKDRGIQNMTAGYYGPRGHQLMAEYILTTFASDFRRKASVDLFMRVVGVSDYVNVVLIPELAVMLIMEDMKVGYERAREILQESTRLGELLHEETLL